MEVAVRIPAETHTYQYADIYIASSIYADIYIASSIYADIYITSSIYPNSSKASPQHATAQVAEQITYTSAICESARY